MIRICTLFLESENSLILKNASLVLGSLCLDKEARSSMDQYHTLDRLGLLLGHEQVRINDSIFLNNL